jgi:hypothetical protein
MANDTQYTNKMKMTSSPEGTGDNPNVGRLPYALPCLPCLTYLECSGLIILDQNLLNKSLPCQPNDDDLTTELAILAGLTFRGPQALTHTSSDAFSPITSPDCFTVTIPLPQSKPQPQLTPKPTPKPNLNHSPFPTSPSHISRFSHLNPFAYLESDDSDDNPPLDDDLFVLPVLLSTTYIFPSVPLSPPPQP